MRIEAIQSRVWLGRIHDFVAEGEGFEVDLALGLTFTEGGFASASTTGCFGIVAREW